MATNAIQSTPSTTTFNATMAMATTPTQRTSASQGDGQYHVALQVIYSVVLLCGTISLSLMMHVLKSSSVSSTSIAVLNLIFAHFIFLVTVPFRIYYYAAREWHLGQEWCKMVSCMIHIHMFMSFVLYVIILITRLLTFYNKTSYMASLQKTYTVIISVAAWILVLVVAPLIVHFSYGKDENGNNNNTKTCFRFGKHIESAKEFNYLYSTFIIVVAIALTCLQANVLRVLRREHGRQCTSQQVFWAQLKSFFFALIMLVCFVPYHVFRLYYLEEISLQDENELFLSVTTFNCLDMLTFLGRRNCHICLSCRRM
ncbi:unnamed protein product [Ophioblennius macclurei]